MSSITYTQVPDLNGGSYAVGGFPQRWTLLRDSRTSSVDFPVSTTTTVTLTSIQHHPVSASTLDNIPTYFYVNVQFQTIFPQAAYINVARANEWQGCQLATSRKTRSRNLSSMFFGTWRTGASTSFQHQKAYWEHLRQIAISEHF